MKAVAFRRIRQATISPSWEQIGSPLAPIACVLVGLSLLWMWRDALNTVVRDHGARYLVVDQLHGGDPARVSGLAQRAFSP